MPIRPPLLAALVLGMAIGALAASPGIAEVLKKEPAMGQLREGQVVLVDDGTCPQGQIKQVTGGNHVKAGGTKQVERSRRCIPR